MTRQEALAKGLKEYFTGKPCPKGHNSKHRIYGGCCECARLGKIVWRKANPERVKKLKLAEQKRNRDSANARNRKYAEANREKLREKNLAWEKSNPGKVLAKAAKRRFSKRQQMPAWADNLAIECVYAKAAEMRKEGMYVHVDHIVPLQGRDVLGLHVHNNLQIIGANANRRKSNSLRGI